MDSIVHGVAKSQTKLRDFHFHPEEESRFLRDYISSKAPKIITRKMIQTKTGFILAKCLRSIWYILSKSSIINNESVTYPHLRVASDNNNAVPTVNSAAPVPTRQCPHVH